MACGTPGSEGPPISGYGKDIDPGPYVMNPIDEYTFSEALRRGGGGQ